MDVTSTIYLSLMDLLIAKNETAGCERLFALVRSKGLASSAIYDKIIGMYTSSGEMQKAIEKLDLMQNEGKEYQKAKAANNDL